MKNTRTTKTSLGIFSLAVLSLGLGLSTLFGASSVSRVKADSINPNEQAIDPAHYEPLSNASFLATLRDCTGTSLSRRYQVQFESLAITAFYSQRKEIYSVVDDANYSGNRTDPFVDPTTPRGSDLNGYVYHAESSSNTKNGKLYFHNRLKFGNYFSILNTRIVTDCMALAEDYDGLNTIYICDSFEIVESGAFKNVPDSITIQVEASSKPEGWADDWTDASNVEFGVPLDSASERYAMTNQTKSFGEAQDYILGYYGYQGASGKTDYPLTISYIKVDGEGHQTNETAVISKKHLTNPYDAVGSNIGSLSNTFNVTIDLDYDEEIVEESVEFYNIFEAVKQYNDELHAWPVDQFQRIYDFYKYDEEPFPTMEGEKFTYQLFENDKQAYITVASHADSDAEAQQLVDQYKALLLDIVDDEENPIFELDSNYDVNKYGEVYRAKVVNDADKHFNLYAQLYTYDAHFIAYFVIDELVPNLDSDGNQIMDDNGTPDDSSDDFPSYKLSRTLPISPKKAAVRPYNWVPNIDEITKEGFYYSESIKRYNSVTFIENIFDLSYASSSKFVGYTSIGMNAAKKLETAYGATLVSDPTKTVVVLYDETTDVYYNDLNVYYAYELNFIGNFIAPTEYILNSNVRALIESQHLNGLLAGTTYFRYILSNLNNSYFVIKYRSNSEVLTKRVNINSPSPVVELSSNVNKLKFLINNSDIDGVGAENILALGISEVTVNIHLFNSSTKSVIGNTELLKVFGTIEVLPYSENQLKTFSIDLYIVLFFVILTAVYALGTTGLFFYQKNKYKNDEFKRVKPKQFLKTALASYLGLVLLALAINFIVLRFGVFYSSIPTFNPIDPFVIGFGVAGAISLGLFIRMFVIIAKQNKTAKEAKRLHLDKDVVDDGTK